MPPTNDFTRGGDEPPPVELGRLEMPAPAEFTERVVRAVHVHTVVRDLCTLHSSGFATVLQEYMAVVSGLWSAESEKENS